MVTNNPKFQTMITWEYDPNNGKSKVISQWTRSLTGYADKKKETQDLRAEEITEEFM